jgi:hypothetical protein
MPPKRLYEQVQTMEIAFPRTSPCLQDKFSCLPSEILFGIMSFLWWKRNEIFRLAYISHSITRVFYNRFLPKYFAKKKLKYSQGTLGSISRYSPHLLSFVQHFCYLGKENDNRLQEWNVSALYQLLPCMPRLQSLTLPGEYYDCQIVHVSQLKSLILELCPESVLETWNFKNEIRKTHSLFFPPLPNSVTHVTFIQLPVILKNIQEYWPKNIIIDLENHPSLTSLSILRYSSEQYILRLPKLSYLHLQEIYVEMNCFHFDSLLELKVDWHSFCFLLKDVSFPQLQRLTFIGGWTNDFLLKNMPVLQSFTIQHPRRIPVFHSLSICELHLVAHPGPKHAIKSIPFGDLPVLRKLTLAGFTIKWKLAWILPCFTELILHSTNIYNVSTTEWAEKLPRLKEIQLYHSLIFASEVSTVLTCTTYPARPKDFKEQIIDTKTYLGHLTAMENILLYADPFQCLGPCMFLAV